MKHFRQIIFDLDGTLVDAYAAIIKSFNHTMRALGYPALEGARIRRAVGWGDRLLLKPFLKKKDLEKALPIYRRHHLRSLKRGCRLLPYARQLLKRLKSKGYLLAIASNRPTRFSLIIVRHLKIEGYFDYVLCADRLTHAKPDPEILRKIMRKFRVSPEEALYVGDMTIDAQTGKAAAVKTVIVTTGSSAKTQIKKIHPYRIIASLKELPAIAEA